MDSAAAPTPSLTGHDFFDRARARLRLEVPNALLDLAAPATRGDLDQDPELWTRAGVTATRPAAVLVPVVDRPDPTVLLTQRTAELPSHAGQVALRFCDERLQRFAFGRELEAVVNEVAVFWNDAVA